MVEERRQFPRLVPTSPLFLALNDSKNGLLLDVGQGGLALASLMPKALNEVISLDFELPGSHTRIQTKAEIAWTRDSGHLTGARFIDLDDSSRQELNEWIARKMAPAKELQESLPLEPQEQCPEPETKVAEEPSFAVREDYAQTEPVPQAEIDRGVAHLRSAVIPLQMTRDRESTAPTVKSDEGFRGYIASRHPAELFLTVVVLSWALVFLGYQMGSTGKLAGDAPTSSKFMESTAPTRVEAANLSPVATVPPTPRPASEPVAKLTPLEEPGVVLQVAAMKQEDNAEALAKSLQQKSYPAFVFKKGSDRLYKVAVGPYSDAEATIKVRGDLNRQGLKAILRRWHP